MVEVAKGQPGLDTSVSGKSLALVHISFFFPFLAEPFNHQACIVWSIVFVQSSYCLLYCSQRPKQDQKGQKQPKEIIPWEGVKKVPPKYTDLWIIPKKICTKSHGNAKIGCPTPTCFSFFSEAVFLIRPGCWKFFSFFIGPESDHCLPL